MPAANPETSLLWPIVAPLAASAAAFVLGGRWCVRLGLGTVPLVVAAAGVVTVRVARQGVRSYPLGGWGAPLGIELSADGLACAMLLMSAVVGTAVSLYAAGYFAASDDAGAVRRAERFWPLWLMLWSALHALFLSSDLFNLYVALELLTLAAVGLVALDDRREALAAALRYLLTALAGSLFYLGGVALMYAAYGVLDVGALAGVATPDVGALAGVATTDQAARAALLLIVLGLMLKTALFPWHFWLPPAHGSAPAPASAVLSGLVVKGSFYVLLRLWFDVFPPDLARPLAQLPVVLGVAAIVWGSLQALAAERLKMLVAYSTVAQIGYLFLVFGLADSGEAQGSEAWGGVVLFAFSHALAKGSLFLASGVVLRAAGHDRLRDLPGVSRRIPITYFAMALAGVSLMGLPPSAAFVGKWMLLKVALAGGRTGLAAVIVLGGLLAAAYLFRVLAAAFERPAGNGPAPAVRPVPRGMEYAALGLALLSLGLGLASAPVLELLEVGSPWERPALPEAAP